MNTPVQPRITFGGQATSAVEADLPGGVVMDGEQAREATRQQVIGDLRELIIALDRRVPRLERTGEVDIARDAAALRHEAVERLAELERAAP